MRANKKLFRCARCILDSSISESGLVNDGQICDVCQQDPAVRNQLRFGEEFDWDILRQTGTRGRYEALIGVSGGVDSSILALKAKDAGINALLLHFDNGWNSVESIQNIANLCDYTDFDLVTHVVDWEKFSDIQRAYLRAGVVDLDVVTDNAIFGATKITLKKYKIKNVLIGFNYATENFMPKAWNWTKFDDWNLRSIYQRHGEGSLKDYPIMNSLEWFFFRNAPFGCNFYEPLNTLHFSKKDSISYLRDKIAWVDYGEKHYENIFTKFYQAIYLFEKWGIDKRIVHYSDLIRNGELTRYDALERVASPPLSCAERDEIINFVSFRLKVSKHILEDWIAGPLGWHEDFWSNRSIIDLFVRIKRKLR